MDANISCWRFGCDPKLIARALSSRRSAFSLRALRSARSFRRWSFFSRFSSASASAFSFFKMRATKILPLAILHANTSNSPILSAIPLYSTWSITSWRLLKCNGSFAGLRQLAQLKPVLPSRTTPKSAIARKSSVPAASRCISLPYSLTHKRPLTNTYSTVFCVIFLLVCVYVCDLIRFVVYFLGLQRFVGFARIQTDFYKNVN